MTMRVTIAGAGPSGLLLAHHLCRKEGYEVIVFERRQDPRDLPPSELRTYPIALQQPRGLEALSKIPGLQSACEAMGIWTVGTCVHNGKTGKVRKIQRPHPSLTVDRNNLVLALLNEIMEAPLAPRSSLRIVFDAEIQDLVLAEKMLKVKIGNKGTAKEHYYDCLVACDGARSTIRQMLVNDGLMEAKTEFVDDEYKSLYLSKASADGMSPDLMGDTIHGWIMGDQRVIAGPAADGKTFGGVYVFPQGQDPFAKLENGQAVIDYFRQQSPQSLWKYVTLEEADEFLKRPVSNSIGVTVDRLHVDSVLLLGDAAHAVSASLGQGCNSALEDVTLFCELLDKEPQGWPSVMKAFTESRLADVHALGELSTHATPRTTLMRFEWVLRNMFKAILPEWLQKCLLRPLPMDLLSIPGLSYSEILERCRWWTDRVKHSKKET